MGYAAIAAVLVGASLFGYGLLVLSVSPLGGVWIATVGLSLGLAGVVNTVWAGRRFDLGAADRRALTLSLLGLAVALSVAFVVINGFGGVEFGDAAN